MTYTCGFCGKRKDRESERGEYIYPVPIKGEAGQMLKHQTLDNREGRTACPPCAIEQKMLQRELGLVVVVHERK